jgi:hypothetical protein
VFSGQKQQKKYEKTVACATKKGRYFPAFSSHTPPAYLDFTSLSPITPRKILVMKNNEEENRD